MHNATQSPPPDQSTFGEIDKSAWRPEVIQKATDFQQIAHGPEFTELRGAMRRFTFPMSAAFLTWYLCYVVLAAYFPDFMGTRLFGTINVGLLMGLGQFASTLLITAWYLRYARREIDPRVRGIYLDATGEEPR